MGNVPRLPFLPSPAAPSTPSFVGAADLLSLPPPVPKHSKGYDGRSLHQPPSAGHLRTSQEQEQMRNHTVWCGSEDKPLLQRKLAFRGKAKLERCSDYADMDTLPWLDSRKALDSAQLRRLFALLSGDFVLATRDSRVAAHTTLFQLIVKLRQKAVEHGITPFLNGVRLVGSAASRMLTEDAAEYGDADIVFYCRDKAPSFDALFAAECEAIAELVSGAPRGGVPTAPTDVKEGFLYECVRVFGACPWSVIAVGTRDGACAERPLTADIKFVFSTQRTYDFSVSSFEISLDALLNKGACYQRQRHVMVECSYGNFDEALGHCVRGVIATRSPRTLQRGLIRYCHACAKGLAAPPACRAALEQAFLDTFLDEFCNTAQNVSRHQTFTHTLAKHVKPSNPHYTVRFLTKLRDVLSHCAVPEVEWFVRETENMLGTVGAAD